MSVVSTFTPDQNFWEANPQLELVPEFKALKKADKSRAKEESSLIMWYIAFCYDLDAANKFRGLPLAERQQLLGEELLGSESYYKDNSKKLEPLIAMYLKLSDSPAKRQLRMLEKKLDEKTAFLENTPYDADNWEVVEKIMKDSAAVYKTLATIQKDLAEEQGDGHVQGGSKESLSDSGEI